MKFSKDEVLFELSYIDENYEFSPNSTMELESYLFSRNLVEQIDGSIVTTTEGDILLGYDKDDLKDHQDDEFNNHTESFFYGFHKGEVEDDEY